jgi:hypothetical protein
MPIYTIQAPDGRKVRIEAPDEATAIRGAAEATAKPRGKGSYAAPFDLSGGQSRWSIPKDTYYRDPEGNIRLNENFDEGNPIVTAPRKAAARGKGVPVLNELAGLAANFNRRILIGDEFTAGLGTAADALTGKVRPRAMPGDNALMAAARGVGDAFDRNMSTTQRVEDDAAERRPLVAGAVGGLGTTATMIIPGAPAMQAAAAGRVGAAALTGGMNAAAQGYASGILDRGSLQERSNQGVVNALFAAPLGGGLGYLAGGGRVPFTRGAPASVGGIIPDVPDDVARQALRYVAKQGEIPAVSPIDGPVLAGEVMGRRGQVALGALARREGATADALSGQLYARAIDRPERMLNAIDEITGVPAASAQGQIDNLVERGQKAAKPFYLEGFANTAPMASPAIDRILRRPVVRNAVQRSRNAMLDDDLDPDTLGIVFADDAGEWASDMTPFDTPAPVQAPRAPKRAPSQGDDLATFVSKLGGIRDDGGELVARDADQWHRDSPFRRKLVNPQGVSLEEAAQRAYDAGYFPDVAPPSMDGGGNMQAVSGDDLLRAIDDNLAGKRRFARPADQAALDRMRAADDADYRNSVGDDFDGVYEGRPEPIGAPVYERQPTTQNLDYVIRDLDDQIEELRDRTTKQLPRTGKVRRLIRARDDLRQETFRLAEENNRNPAYVSGVREAGDYLSAEAAFGDAQKQLFSSRVTADQFGKSIRKMSPAQRNAAQAGAANAFFSLQQTGRLKPGALKVPHVQRKLEALFGPDGAAKLQRLARDEDVMLAFERRYAPGIGSVTSDITQAIREQDDSFEDVLISAGTTAITQGSRAGMGELVGRVVQAGADRIKTRGMPVPVRDAAGRVLMMSPDEARNLLARPAASAAPRQNPLALPAPESEMARLRNQAAARAGRASGASVSAMRER